MKNVDFFVLYSFFFFTPFNHMFWETYFFFDNYKYWIIICVWQKKPEFPDDFHKKLSYLDIQIVGFHSRTFRISLCQN